MWVGPRAATSTMHWRGSDPATCRAAAQLQMGFYESSQSKFASIASNRTRVGADVGKGTWKAPAFQHATRGEEKDETVSEPKVGGSARVGYGGFSRLRRRGLLRAVRGAGRGRHGAALLANPSRYGLP